MWSKFWAGLNIRKCISLCFTLTFCVASVVVIVYGINSNNTEVILSGIAGISSILSSCIGYYFGYSNGVNIKNTNTNTEIKDSL